jgi:hypothetical protein
MKTTKRIIAALLTYALVGCFAISYAVIVVLAALHLVVCRVLGIAPEQYPPRDPR